VQETAGADGPTATGSDGAAPGSPVLVVESESPSGSQKLLTLPHQTAETEEEREVIRRGSFTGAIARQFVVSIYTQPPT